MSRSALFLAVMVTAVLLAGGVLLTSSSDAHAQASEEATFVVDSTSDSADINPGDGTCDADGTASGNQCTLRAAIQEANAAAGSNAIHFDIPGDGIKTIKLTSQLPTLTDTSGPTTIDGYTQKGSSPNTRPRASNAKITVQIEGGGYQLFGGLVIESAGNVVRGLALYKLGGPVRLRHIDAHDNRIEGNFIGTDATGGHYAASIARGGTASGVKLYLGASKNVIGGVSVADRNVISGNGGHGVVFYDAGTDSNRIVGNLIGLTPSGRGDLPNMSVGVDINNDASHNVVGGTLHGERNVISGNGREGVEISHHEDTSANRVIGNYIGTNLTGESAPEYARNGWRAQTLRAENLDAVHLTDGARDSVVAHNVIGNAYRSGVGIDSSNTTGNTVYANRIGISGGGAGIPNAMAGIEVRSGPRNSQIGPSNVIANNPVGVRVIGTETTSTAITRNSIYNNATLGIDLGGDGPTQNDLGDADLGPNGLQNAPVIGSAVSAGDMTSIEGILNSTPSSTFLIRFFSNPEDTDQGRQFVGQANVTTNADGTVSFDFTPTKVVRVGRTITATATDEDGNTSEFSAPKTVTQL